MSDAPEQPATLKDKIQAVIDTRMRPAIQGDGGDIELVDVDSDGVVSVKLHGACVGCPGAKMTLKMGVERSLRQLFPEVKEVVCVS